MSSFTNLSFESGYKIPESEQFFMVRCGGTDKLKEKYARLHMRLAGELFFARNC